MCISIFCCCQGSSNKKKGFVGILKRLKHFKTKTYNPLHLGAEGGV